MDGVEHQVELHDRSSAEPVDEQKHVSLRVVVEIGQDGRNHLLCNIIGGGELDPAASGLTVNAYSHFHFIFANSECRLPSGRHGTACQCDPHRARTRVGSVAQRLQGREIGSGFRCCTCYFLDDEGSGHPAPSSRIKRVFYRDIVVRNDSFGFAGVHLSCHVEIHDIAFVILDDEKNASAVIHCIGCGKYLIGRGRGEHLSRAGCIEHAQSDKTRMQRFVPRTAARNQRDLPFF